VFKIETIKNRRNKGKLIICDVVRTYEIQTKYFQI